MAFNAYLVLHKRADIKGESQSLPDDAAANMGAIEITDFGFGVSMPVTTSRSDGGGATVGRANFDVFTCSKSIDTATCALMDFCCKGTAVDTIVLHLYRAGDDTASGAVKYAMYVFQACVITKVAISGGGEELPKESLEFNYGVCEYWYQLTKKDTGKWDTARKPDHRGWSTIKNKVVSSGQQFPDFPPCDFTP